jgi:hypothetical protein
MTEPTGPPPDAGQQRPSVRAFWRRRSWKGKTGIIVGAVFVALILIGLLAPAPDESSDVGPTQAATTEAAATTSAPTTTAQTTTAQATTQEAETETRAAEPSDTGRLSESEFATFQRAHQEVVDESLQFTNEVQACAVIGQSGDFAGFRECNDSAYAGFEEDADAALFTANDLLDDAAKKCRAALNSYVKVLTDYSATVKTAYEVGNRLDFDAMTIVYPRLPVQSRRYAKFSLNALRACEPT